MKIPDPMTIPATSIVASRSPRARTSWPSERSEGGSRGQRAAVAGPIWGRPPEGSTGNVRPPPRRSDERLEEGPRLGDVGLSLGMPEDTHDEPAPRPLDGLDHAIGRPGDRPESLPAPAARVVMARHALERPPAAASPARGGGPGARRRGPVGVG